MRLVILLHSDMSLSRIFRMSAAIQDQFLMHSSSGLGTPGIFCSYVLSYSLILAMLCCCFL